MSFVKVDAERAQEHVLACAHSSFSTVELHQVLVLAEVHRPAKHPGGAAAGRGRRSESCMNVGLPPAQVSRAAAELMDLDSERKKETQRNRTNAQDLQMHGVNGHGPKHNRTQQKAPNAAGNFEYVEFMDVAQAEKPQCTRAPQKRTLLQSQKGPTLLVPSGIGRSFFPPRKWQQVASCARVLGAVLAKRHSDLPSQGD